MSTAIHGLTAEQFEEARSRTLNDECTICGPTTWQHDITSRGQVKFVCDYCKTYTTSVKVLELDVTHDQIQALRRQILTMWGEQQSLEAIGDTKKAMEVAAKLQQVRLFMNSVAAGQVK